MCEVLISGAGPVGLLLAGELAARDVRVVVLERADAPSSIPKANGVVGSAAIALKRRGLLTGTGLRVVSPPRFPFGPLMLNLGWGPANPLHVLPIPQRRLEQLLEDRAVRSGAEVRRGHDLVSFAQDDRGVAVSAAVAGVQRELRARYLVGCDGARSRVRTHAGIDFPGVTGEEIARIAHVTIPAERITVTADRCEIAGIGRVVAMRSNRMAGGGFTIAPMSVLDRDAPGDQYLITTREPRRGADPSDTLPAEELRASLRRVLGAELPFTEATAVRSTLANSRQAGAYQQGRVFLAGDAAHIFSAGGSALNVGLQDALDLAPRLCAALSAGPRVQDLAGYDRARRPAGERALRHTRAQAALNRDDESGRALCAVVAELTADRRAARRLARMIEDA